MRVEWCSFFRVSSSERLFISGTHINLVVLSVRATSSSEIGFIRQVRCVQPSGSLPKIVHGHMDRRVRSRNHAAPSCLHLILADCDPTCVMRMLIEAMILWSPSAALASRPKLSTRWRPCGLDDTLSSSYGS